MTIALALRRTTIHMPAKAIFRPNGVSTGVSTQTRLQETPSGRVSKLWNPFAAIGDRIPRLRQRCKLMMQLGKGEQSLKWQRPVHWRQTDRCTESERWSYSTSLRAR